jgi:threonine synthase
MNSLLEKYRRYLPLEGVAPVNGLGEGNTPLIKSGIGGSDNLFFKLEQLNPTGSFKDRFAAVETALMRHKGVQACIATSSGNTGSALAAYSARRGMRCLILVNETAQENKLRQILAYGARIFRVRGLGVSNEQSALIFDRLQELAEQSHTRLVISAFKYSPLGMEGIKTIAYELAEQLGAAPDQIFVPVGGGGLLSGIWRGFLDLKERLLIGRLPRMNAVQPTLNDTVVTPLIEGLDQARDVDTTTSISGLAVQIDIDATLALKSVRASGGRGYSVEEEEIQRVQRQLCLRDGMFVEPAGATSVAGYLKAASLRDVRADEKVICILTGHGLKDMSSVGRFAQRTQIRKIDLSDITSKLIESETVSYPPPF